MAKFTARIPVHDEDREIFKKWATYFEMTVMEKRRDPYVDVSFDEIENLYWLAANFFCNNTETAITKPAVT